MRRYEQRHEPLQENLVLLAIGEQSISIDVVQLAFVEGGTSITIRSIFVLCRAQAKKVEHPFFHRVVRFVPNRLVQCELVQLPGAPVANGVLIVQLGLNSKLVQQLQGERTTCAFVTGEGTLL